MRIPRFTPRQHHIETLKRRRQERQAIAAIKERTHKLSTEQQAAISQKLHEEFEGFPQKIVETTPPFTTFSRWFQRLDELMKGYEYASQN